jgi:pyridoxine 5-phosphate synthase
MGRAAGADRVERMPGRSHARSSSIEAARLSLRSADAARLAHSLKLGVNAGHDLDLENLTIFRQLPHLDEVSIGHAILARAIFVGLEKVLSEYLAVLARA